MATIIREQKMRHIFTVLAICLQLSGFSQGLFEYFKLTAADDGPEKFDRIAVDFTLDSWMGLPADVETNVASLGLNACWYKDIPLGKKSRVAIAFGLGVGSHNVHHNGEFVHETSGNSYTDLHPLSTTTEWKKNKFVANYIDVPIELRFRNMNIKPRSEDRRTKSFRFYPGFKVGALLNNHVKWKDDEIKYKVYNIKNVLRYRYGVTLRIAFNKFAVFGFYSLSPLFESGKGVELYPISIGVSWIRF